MSCPDSASTDYSVIQSCVFGKASRRELLAFLLAYQIALFWKLLNLNYL